jgi:hypothetical protein
MKYNYRTKGLTLALLSLSASSYEQEQEMAAINGSAEKYA